MPMFFTKRVRKFVKAFTGNLIPGEDNGTTRIVMRSQSIVDLFRATANPPIAAQCRNKFRPF